MVIYEGFCRNSQAFTQYGEEGSEVEIDKRIGKVILGVKKKGLQMNWY